MVWANPTLSRHGPSNPNAGIRTITSRGFRVLTVSQSSPNWSMTRGEKFSTRASETSMSRCSNSMPSGRVRSKVTDRLPTLAWWKVGPNSHQESSAGVRAEPNLIPSGRCTDSIWMTSAPSVASTSVP